MKGFGIYVQNDLLEPKHYKAIGGAIWFYLWCLDKMTSINENGIGLVLGGKPIKLQDVNKDLELSDRTYSRYIKTLQTGGYIDATRTPYGYVIKVTKAKKQFGKTVKRTVNLAPRTVNLAGENRKFGGNKEDNTVDNTITSSEQSSGNELSDKKQDMRWNKYSEDYEEGVVDLDSGELHDPVAEEKEKDKELNAKFRTAIDWLITHQGRDPKRTPIPKQLKAIKKLYTMGVSAKEAKQIIIECEGSDVWKGKQEKPDFWTVVSIIQKRG